MTRKKVRGGKGGQGEILRKVYPEGDSRRAHDDNARAGRRVAGLICGPRHLGIPPLLDSQVPAGARFTLYFSSLEKSPPLRALTAFILPVLPCQRSLFKGHRVILEPPASAMAPATDPGIEEQTYL